MKIPKLIRNTSIYMIVRHLYVARIIGNQSIKDGITKYSKNKPPIGSLNDFKRCVRKHLVWYDEFFHRIIFMNEQNQKEKNLCLM